MDTAARRTFVALDLHYLQVGTDSPRIVATDGQPGTLYIQVPVYPYVAPIKVWQKQDYGVTTNWNYFGNTDILDYKAPVKAASTGDVNIAVAPAMIDTVALVAGDRVLLKDQAAPAENGIYVFAATGAPLTRAPDADESDEVTFGMFTWVVEGSVNVRTGWILTTPDPIDLGVTALTFVEIPIPAVGRTEFRTVTAPEAAAKQLTLLTAPVDPSAVVVAAGGVAQFYGDDYTVTGAVLDWNGLGMDAIPIAAGDKLVIQY